MNTPLNFARVPFRNERLPLLIYGLAAVSLLGTTVTHGVILTRYLLREQEELDVKVAALDEELERRETELQQTENELRSERSEARTERIRFLTATYRQKSFSWTGLFNELEAITPAAVRITSIAPSAEQGQIQVRLHVVGRTLADVLEMVGELEAHQLFGTVLPLNETQESEEGGEIAATLMLQVFPERAGQEPATPVSTEATEAEEEQSEEPVPTSTETSEDEETSPVGGRGAR